MFKKFLLLYLEFFRTVHPTLTLKRLFANIKFAADMPTFYDGG